MKRDSLIWPIILGSILLILPLKSAYVRFFIEPTRFNHLYVIVASLALAAFWALSAYLWQRAGRRNR